MSDAENLAEKLSKSGDYSWTRRRLMMYVVLFFCMAVIAYILKMGLDTKVADTIATMAFYTIIGIIGAYVFGGTWQDVAKIKANFKGDNGA